MTALLRKRIKRIEAEVTEPVAARSKVAILIEPNEDADRAATRKHEKALAQAMRENEKVIVVSARYTERTEAGEGLVYVPSEVQALMEKLSTAPTTGPRAAGGSDAAWLATIKPVLFGVVGQPRKSTDDEKKVSDEYPDADNPDDL